MTKPETKQKVFEDALDMLRAISDAYDRDFGAGEPDPETMTIQDELRQRFAAATSDDLPVIPKAVGEYIQWGKSYDIQLYMMFSFKFIHSQGFKKLTDDVESWIISSSNAFALAWLLGVWRVEETGEIVKLEAER
ncbi:hypothetical protein [Lacticaseibacillus rhamnosus]|uniref:hypothetical protein n=1 Tax=Lacticaseibacillus rhamnosus TaxID=47715 RepID=UPI0023E0AC35|nr:hypothetical protein [Lacticaseibacillus rhamnosus]MDF3335581.1 hypothetical protein [Lacticaseibacillus rhamnosus]